MTAAKLGAVQTRIMQVLWQCEQATAREITDELNRRFPKEPIAHSTVQTLLRTLMNKGSVKHQTQGRTFVFRASVSQEKFRKTATRDLMQKAFGGKAVDLVSFLLKNEKVSKKELEAIRDLINQRSQQ